MNAVGAAKSQLNQFYQRCKSPLPRYDVKQAGSGFKCTIICPSVYTSEGAVELQLFTGKGATKKASQAAAAAEAVKFLQDQPLFAAKKPFVESLWETVKGSLSDQVLSQRLSKLTPANLPSVAYLFVGALAHMLVGTCIKFWLLHLVGV